MLSPPQTNASNNLFNLNHPFTLITQPILGARSRKKDKIDSITNTRRNSYHDSSILSIHGLEKSQFENKSSYHKSLDSGIDLPLSTDLSAQHITIHRPLSTLNENFHINDNNHKQSIRIPNINLVRNHSVENLIKNNIHEQQQQHHSNSLFNEKEKINHDTHLNTLKELHQQTNTHPLTQQHRSSNNININSIHTITRKPNRPLLKPIKQKTNSNIIIEPSIPISSSHLTNNNNNEQIHSITRITNNQHIKPIGHNSNQEQLRAHINRSILDRQYPSYSRIPPRRNSKKSITSLDNSLSKVNNRSSRQQKQSTNIIHSNTNIPEDVSTIQKLNLVSPRQTKQTLPVTSSEKNINNHQEKRRLNQKKSPINRVQIEQTINPHHIIISNKNHQEKIISYDINKKQRIEENQISSFLTSTPRYYCEIENDYKNNRQRQFINETDEKFKYNQSNSTTFPKRTINNLNRRQQQQQSTDIIQKSKANEHINRIKNRIIHPNNDCSETEDFRRNTLIPFRTRLTRENRIPNIQCHMEQTHRINQKEKILDESMNTLLRTTRIHPTNTNNIQQEGRKYRINNTSKINSIQIDKKRKKSNKFLQKKLSISKSVVSNQKLNLQRYDPSESLNSSYHESIDNKLNLTYRLVVINEQQPLQRRLIIPTENSEFLPITNASSQTSSHHTYPFTYTTNSSNINNGIMDKSLHDLTTSNKVENIIDHRDSLILSHDRLSLSLGKITNSKEDDDISTNDGWSDDSIEIIYIDEHYISQKN
ncbi:unnamed protein product [Adineta steineri]|uniref:Uncharacterized protein n=1 Tax=Adineta steineri TaxID=433720 RepID=A0A815JS94_9BILA|nr:unnamed protein product [Adineta steineri]CAF3864005.1 unnamed protein product [Adineta steineri]